MIEICHTPKGDAICADGIIVSEVYDNIIATQDMLSLGDFIAIRINENKREYSYRKIENGKEVAVTDWAESPDGLAKMYAHLFDEKDEAQMIIEDLLHS